MSVIGWPLSDHHYKFHESKEGCVEIELEKDHRRLTVRRRRVFGD